jgi:hypothetical protein
VGGLWGLLVEGSVAGPDLALQNEWNFNCNLVCLVFARNSFSLIPLSFKQASTWGVDFTEEAVDRADSQKI